MRCPKCGYISFDHLEKCLKCNKDIEAVSDGLFGSTYNIKAPTFLVLNRQPREEPSEDMDFSEEQSFDVDDGYVDDELAVLVEEEDTDTDGEIEFADDEQPSVVMSEDDEQDDEGEIEIDFSQFEDADEPEVNLFDENELEDEVRKDQAAQHSLKIDLPEELADISDLAPPARSIEEDDGPSEKPADTDFSDLDLDDLNFDLGLDDLDGDNTKSPAVAEEAILALDEIDFSETLAESGSDKSKKTENMDMDLDLDFDLDLGGLSIHKDV